MDKWQENCKRHSEFRMKWRHPDQHELVMPARRRFKRFEGFRICSIGPNIHSAVIEKDLSKLSAIKQFSQCRSVHEYQLSMKTLLQAEEVHHAIELRTFDNLKGKIYFDHDKGGMLERCKIKVPGLANKQPSLMPFDFAILQSTTQSSWSRAVQIVSIQGDYAILAKFDSLSDEAHLRERLNIAFISSGTTFAACQRAIYSIQDKRRMQMILFEDNIRDGYDTYSDTDNENDDHNIRDLNIFLEIPEPNLEHRSTPELLERLDRLNDRQRQAVLGILRAECWPKPYILYGPPGTGKSHTIIEAVAQIYLRSRELKILVCMNANTCVDHMYDNLQARLPRASILRLRAGEYFTGLEEAQRIVVTTNIKASSLSGFNGNEFDYVFADEAGHAHEPESLVPIRLVKHTGTLVLAGDPQQLGPVVMCREVGRLGLDWSLLERLLKFRVYQRDPVTGEYDSKYITKLTECYRSDKRILATCNKLFYDNELECIQETPRSLLKILRLTGPVQLKSVYGCQSRPGLSTSWMNEAEARSCADIIIRLYKTGLMPNQIGVITPYRLQSKEISGRLKKAIKANTMLLNRRFRCSLKGNKSSTGNENRIELNSGDAQSSSISDKVNAENGLPPIVNKLLGRGNSTYDAVVQRMQELCLKDCGDTPADSCDTSETSAKPTTNWMCKIDSVDAFQGNEREVIIISTVRTSGSDSSLEFLNDPRRFNVAVSRAKWLLIVVGDPNILNRGEYWPRLMDHAKKGQMKDWSIQSIIEPVAEDIRKPIAFEELTSDEVIRDLRLTMQHTEPSQETVEHVMSKCNHALESYENLSRQNDPDYAKILDFIATIKIKAKLYNEAVDFLIKAVKIRQKALGPDHILVAETLCSLVDVSFETSKYRGALPLCEKALKIKEKHYTADHPELGMHLTKMGDIYEKLEEFDNARFNYARAIHIYKNSPDFDDSSLVQELERKVARMAELSETYSLVGKCKICLGNPIEIIYLPCGHLASCSTCSEHPKDCPVCRAPIMTRQRTYFS